MPFLSHGGISLRYERAGTGPSLVFIHGLMGNHTFWDRQLALRQQFQVVRLDLLPARPDLFESGGALTNSLNGTHARGSTQLTAQAPAPSQTRPGSHAVPQAPECWRSRERST